jgi:hypothetical protein
MTEATNARTGNPADKGVAHAKDTFEKVKVPAQEATTRATIR